MRPLTALAPTGYLRYFPRVRSARERMRNPGSAFTRKTQNL